MAWWPGWNSVESTNTWAHIWFWFGMWCFLWLGISEVIAFVYGLRKDHLVEITQTTANVQAQQNQEAAEVRRKAEVEGLQTQLADADKKVADLQRFQAQRHLTDSQKQTLIERLSAFRGTPVAVASLFGDDDGKVYRDDFAEVFNKAGWALEGRVGEAMYDRNIVGVEVSVNKAEAEAGRIPVAAAPLLEVLGALDLVPKLPDGRMTLNKRPETPPGRIHMLIGVKPRN
jgi:hypothetical protein